MADLTAGAPPTLDASQARELAWLDQAQMVEVDRVMMDDLGISLIQMMEHAGRHLAALARDRFLDGDVTGARVAVLAGTGGNGGGGITAARHLHTWGADVTLASTRELDQIQGVPGDQARTAARLGVRSVVGAPPRAGSGTRFDLVIDAVIGYSLRGLPEGMVADLIAWAGAAPAPVLSLDLPSGVDASSGRAHGLSIVPEATLTLAMPKEGLRLAGPDRVGALYLADIGVPTSAYHPLVGRPIRSPFNRSDIVRIW